MNVHHRVFHPGCTSPQKYRGLEGFQAAKAPVLPDFQSAMMTIAAAVPSELRVELKRQIRTFPMTKILGVITPYYVPFILLILCPKYRGINLIR